MPSFLPKQPSPSPIFNITAGQLPAYVSASQAPTKKSPWRIIRDVEYNHSATAILPEELCRLIWQDVECAMMKVRYAKVIMKLEELLHGEFFTEYIKKGEWTRMVESHEQCFRETGTDLSYPFSRERSHAITGTARRRSGLLIERR